MSKIFEYFLHPLAAYKQVTKMEYQPQIRKQKEVSRQISSVANTWLTDFFKNAYDDNRINLYAQGVEIDGDPLMRAIPDAYSYSITQVCTEGGDDEYGRVVYCQTKNADLKKIITAFLDQIKIDTIAFPIVRSMVTFGDQFEGLLGVDGEGIKKLEPFNPWDIAAIEDPSGDITGYTAADPEGEPQKNQSIIPFYQMLHFKMPIRYRKDYYGVRSSIYYNLREYWQDFQWANDKLMIERLQRRPDRHYILMDISGMSSEDAFEVCRRYEDRLYRPQFYDPSAGRLYTQPNAWGEHRDLVLPKGAGNNTTITTAPSTSSSGPMDDVNYFLRLLFGSANFPSGYLGLDIASGYDPGQPIEKQDISFTRACMRIQRAFLSTLMQACIYHLSSLNIDPTSEANSFRLMMEPISSFRELEKKELLMLRFDLISSALNMGTDMNFNQDAWRRFILREYGKFSPDMIEEFLSGGELAREDEVGSVFDSTGVPTNLDEKYEKLLRGDSKLSKRAKEAMEFLRGGASMISSRCGNGYLVENNITIPSTIYKCNGGDVFKKAFGERVKKRAQFRAFMYQGAFSCREKEGI